MFLKTHKTWMTLAVLTEVEEERVEMITSAPRDLPSKRRQNIRIEVVLVMCIEAMNKHSFCL